MIRVFNLVLFLAAPLLLPWWSILLGVSLYAWWYGGLELVPLMILVDTYFGVWHSGVPFLTIGTVGLVCGVAIIRPYMTKSVVRV
jgi:hypothetical protein